MPWPGALRNRVRGGGWPLRLDLPLLLNYIGFAMQPFHALVKNGRLTLDEPTDLPDGQVVVLLPLDELLEMTDDASDDNHEIVTFTLAPPPRREWKKPKPVDAAAILDELRSL